MLDPKIHHANLINSILAKIEATAAGADDALMLDSRGFVAETNATHLFAVTDGALATPRTVACPEGITRSTVLRPGRGRRDRCVERRPHAGRVLQRRRGLLHRHHGRDRRRHHHRRPPHRHRRSRPGDRADRHAFSPPMLAPPRPPCYPGLSWRNDGAGGDVVGTAQHLDRDDAQLRRAGSDALVVDEPLYAHYLLATGLDHPARDEVIASQPPTWPAATAALLAPVPAAVFYQKHMTHHLLPMIGRDWLAQVSNAYLIRDPAAVVASYAKVRGEPTLDDLGYAQQVEIFRRHGGPVVDAADVLRDPRGLLTQLCTALGIGFDEAMLSWPPGPARHRRRLGPALVRGGRGLHRFRPLRPHPAVGAGSPPAPGRPGPPVLRRTRRPPPRLTRRADTRFQDRDSRNDTTRGGRRCSEIRDLGGGRSRSRGAGRGCAGVEGQLGGAG